MWRLLRGVIFLCVVVFIALSSTSSATAAAESLWGTSLPVRLSEQSRDRISTSEKTCSGRITTVEIKGEPTSKEGCVFGDAGGTRLARVALNGGYVYAIAFSTDSAFMVTKNICTSAIWCAYGQEADVLLIQAPYVIGSTALSYVKDFSKYLKRVGNYYDFEYLKQLPVLTSGGVPLSVESVGVSTNGNWAFMEMTDFGFVVFNMKTQEYRRVSFPDFTETDTEPAELTISDDGRWAAATRRSMNPLLFELKDSCGDYLEPPLHPVQFETIACNTWVVNMKSLTLGFTSAYKPRFSHSAERLVLEVEASNRYVTMTLSPSATPVNNPRYIAFGDSFTSGEGELQDSFYVRATNTPENRCHVSSRSYPYLLETSWDIQTLNIACSGSTTHEVKQASNHFIKNDTKGWPTVMSVSVGGNDVGFMGKLKTCLGPGTCEWAEKGSRLSTANEIKGYFAKMIDIIAELKTSYAPAPLFVVGYPNVINDAKDASCSPAVSGLLNHDERRYMSESIRYLNRVIRAAAVYSKVVYADIESVFEGERLCDERDSAMNAVRFGDDVAPIPFASNMKIIGAESFHPTPRGHQLSAQRINSQLQSFWEAGGCSACQYDESQLDFPLYWKEGVGVDDSTFKQTAQTFIHEERTIDTSKVAYSFAPNTFAPNSPVRFELHSEIKQLGSFNVSAEGSLEGVLPMPRGVIGYHTIHAYGESRSGERIDAYQVVYMDTTGLPEDISTPSTGVSTVAIAASSQTPAGETAPNNEISAQTLGVKNNQQHTDRRRETVSSASFGLIAGIAVAVIVGVVTSVVIAVHRKGSRPGG